MFGKKKPDPDCPRLSAEQKQAVPNAHTDPRIIALAQRRKEIEQERRAIEDKLNGGGDGYRFNEAMQNAALAKLVEAELLPAGTTALPDDLIKQGILSRRAELTEESERITQALQRTEREIIAENCAAVDDIAQKMNQTIIANFESLRESLFTWREFLDLLTRRGNTESYRPDKLKFMPYENALIFGGQIQTADFYLEQKQKLWA